MTTIARRPVYVGHWSFQSMYEFALDDGAPDTVEDYATPTLTVIGETATAAVAGLAASIIQTATELYGLHARVTWREGFRPVLEGNHDWLKGNATSALDITVDGKVVDTGVAVVQCQTVLKAPKR